MRGTEGPPFRETVLITGASSGIGEELARLFARDGSDLVLVARTEAKLAALANELEEAHRITVHVVPADLSTPQAPREIFEQAQREGLEIDVLVNNAGFGARGAFAALDLQEQLDMVQVNLTAPTHLSRLFLPGMLERRRGGILNVVSVAGFQPGPWMSVYYATKAFLLHLSEGLAEEVAGRGVTVCCLAPGPTATDFVQRADMASVPLFLRVSMTAREVAEAGHRGFRRGDVLVVPGFRMRLIPAATRLVPRALSRRSAGLLQRRSPPGAAAQRG